MTSPKWFDPKVTLGNVLTAAAMMATLVTGYVNLKLDVQASSDAIAQVKAQVAPVDDMQARLSTVETRINIGQQQREQFQNETKAALEDIRKQNILVLTAIARLEAKQQ